MQKIATHVSITIIHLIPLISVLFLIKGWHGNVLFFKNNILDMHWKNRSWVLDLKEALYDLSMSCLFSIIQIFHRFLVWVVSRRDGSGSTWWSVISNCFCMKFQLIKIGPVSRSSKLLIWGKCWIFSGFFFIYCN